MCDGLDDRTKWGFTPRQAIEAFQRIDKLCNSLIERREYFRGPRDSCRMTACDGHVWSDAPKGLCTRHIRMLERIRTQKKERKRQAEERFRLERAIARGYRLEEWGLRRDIRMVRSEIKREQKISRTHPTTLYRLYDREDCLLYVGVTYKITERMASHQAKKWWVEVDTSKTTLTYFPNRVLAEEAERAAIFSENPKHNVVHRRKAA